MNTNPLNRSDLLGPKAQANRRILDLYMRLPEVSHDLRVMGNTIGGDTSPELDEQDKRATQKSARKLIAASVAIQKAHDILAKNGLTIYCSIRLQR